MASCENVPLPAHLYDVMQVYYTLAAVAVFQERSITVFVVGDSNNLHC